MSQKPNIEVGDVVCYEEPAFPIDGLYVVETVVRIHDGICTLSSTGKPKWFKLSFPSDGLQLASIYGFGPKDIGTLFFLIKDKPVPFKEHLLQLAEEGNEDAVNILMIEAALHNGATANFDPDTNTWIIKDKA